MASTAVNSHPRIITFGLSSLYHNSHSNILTSVRQRHGSPVCTPMSTSSVVPWIHATLSQNLLCARWVQGPIFEVARRPLTCFTMIASVIHISNRYAFNAFSTMTSHSIFPSSLFKSFYSPSLFSNCPWLIVIHLHVVAQCLTILCVALIKGRCCILGYAARAAPFQIIWPPKRVSAIFPQFNKLLDGQVFDSMVEGVQLSGIKDISIW